MTQKMRFIGHKKDGGLMKGAPGNYKQGQIVSLPFKMSKFKFWELIEKSPEFMAPSLEPYPPEPTLRPQTYLRRGQPIKVLTIIDVYGWAYDEGCRGLYAELSKRHPSWTLDTASLEEVLSSKVNPRDYDCVLVWCWFAANGGKLKPYLNLLQRLDMRRSILCVAGMYVLPLLPQASIYLREAFYMAGNNLAITDSLRQRSKYTRVYTLEYGVDLERFKPTPLPAEFTVGWAGHQKRTLKRFGLAEEICRQAKVPLRVAGHISSDLYVPSSQMPEWYDGNTVQLITSDSEAHPLVYYEAMAKGRIPISTLVGDIPGTAVDGVNGYYLPVDAPVEAYVEVLNKIKGDKPLLERMSRAARQSVEEKWSWRRIADNYEEAITEVSGAYTGESNRRPDGGGRGEHPHNMGGIRT